MTANQLPDYRLDTRALMQVYGYLSRTTFIKHERDGKIPKRRKYPDGQLGTMWSEVKAWIDSAEVEGATDGQ
ncbi:MAG: hypothetical protein L3K52_08025 [Candidatus Thiothrix sulfatifontis]|nr:MAG: hypothetical protein L3K52_08025 [Candidatus Thiothrix sulfatifontis]